MKLPRLTWKEILSMFQVTDFRETRVYQEAFQEGKEVGFKEGFEIGFEMGISIARGIAKLSFTNMSVEEIAARLKVDAMLVRKFMATAR
jgi:predicted transposase YdaD